MKVNTLSVIMTRYMFFFREKVRYRTKGILEVRGNRE